MKKTFRNCRTILPSTYVGNEAKLFLDCNQDKKDFKQNIAYKNMHDTFLHTKETSKLKSAIIISKGTTQLIIIYI